MLPFCLFFVVGVMDALGVIVIAVGVVGDVSKGVEGVVAVVATFSLDFEIIFLLLVWFSKREG